MNLQAIKEKVEGLKEEKARTEERLKSLNEKKEEILEELKEYGVKSIKDIDGKVNGLKKELNVALKDFEEIETEEDGTIDPNVEGAWSDKEIAEAEKEMEEADNKSWEVGENGVVENKTKKKKGNDFLEDLDL